MYQLLHKKDLRAWSDQTEDIDKHILTEWRRCRTVMVKHWETIGKDITDDLPSARLDDRSPFLKVILLTPDYGS
jgi:hypothetical protein